MINRLFLDALFLDFRCYGLRKNAYCSLGKYITTFAFFPGRDDLRV